MALASRPAPRPAPRRAVVLAAGRGRRLGQLTDRIPKPLVAVAGRPLLRRLLDALGVAGIGQIEIVTGYLAERLEAEVFSWSREPGCAWRADFHRQTGDAGTAAALLACRVACADEPFLLSWGDVLAEPDDYRALVRCFCQEPWDHVLGVNAVGDPSAGAAVTVLADGSVSSVVEKPAPGASTTPWNNAGIFVLGPEIFRFADLVQPSPRGERELPDAIQAMIEAGRRIGAREIAGWRHVGTPEELAAVQSRLGGSREANPACRGQGREP